MTPSSCLSISDKRGTPSLLFFVGVLGHTAFKNLISSSSNLSMRFDSVACEELLILSKQRAMWNCTSSRYSLSYLMYQQVKTMQKAFTLNVDIFVIQRLTGCLADKIEKMMTGSLKKGEDVFVLCSLRGQAENRGLEVEGI